MMKNKKGFFLYPDLIHTVVNLTDEEAGRLFKHYLKYINDLNPKSDRLTELIFEPIKQNLKREFDNFVKKSAKNSKIAKDSWSMRNDANACETMRNDANACETMRNDANACETMRNDANACETMRNDANALKRINSVNNKVNEQKTQILPKVLLHDYEIEKLKTFFGEKYQWAIDELENYKQSSGKQYKSDYHALMGWVKDKYINENKTQKEDKKLGRADQIIQTHNEVKQYFDTLYKSENNGNSTNKY